MDTLTDLSALVRVVAPTLEHWYEYHKRDLPWRHTRDPYRIWLSEVILQQTRVAQGLPYYRRFVAAYPTVTDLANADERELLRHWQGLGYYARARNLHQTARHIALALNGQFPTTYEGLLALKGIGTYTAAAVASFAYNERVPVIDGNVYRVLARLFGIDADITTTAAKKTFARLAQELIQHANCPATYNQAVMEFGAIQCTPVAPDCLLCPLQQQCRAFLTGRQHLLPVKAKKAPVRERFFHYVVFRQRSEEGVKLALRERSDRDIWQRLYDFYLIEADAPATLAELPLPAEVTTLLQQDTLTGPARAGQQLLSHQRIRAQFYVVDLPANFSEPLPAGLRWYNAEQIRQLPKPVIISAHFEQWLG